MEISREIIKKTYLYYPKKLCFESYEYQSSKEYLRRLERREETDTNTGYQKYIEYTLKNIFKNHEVVNWTIKQFLISQKYVQLSEEVAKEIIDDVETELRSMGSATVFDCFFTDIITI